MKFIIKNAKEKKSEPKIELWLKDEGDYIALEGKDKNGDKRYLMVFRNGKFSRHAASDIEGLETDISGKIIEEE